MPLTTLIAEDIPPSSSRTPCVHTDVEEATPIVPIVDNVPITEEMGSALATPAAASDHLEPSDEVIVLDNSDFAATGLGRGIGGICSPWLG